MSISRAIPSLARYASTSAGGSHKVVVIGAGAGGLAAANQVYNLLKSQGKTLNDGDIAIVDSNPYHDYQPGWTVTGAGLAPKTDFRRPLQSLIPSHIAQIKAKASGFEPGTNQVVLDDGSKVGYEYLIVAPGLQINWDKIKGLSNAIAEPSKSNVSTIYSYDTADKTFDLIQNFKGQGEAIFTQPFGVIKCAGAPQKVAYMADSYWKSTNNKYSTSFITGMPTMFAQPDYAKALNAIREEKGISGTFNTNLVEVRPDTKTAVFEVLAGEDKGKKIEKEFGLLHVVPPMGPLDAIKNSPLADAVGWVDVDQGSLQHKKYENIFSLGDASSLPTSKTAAAITAQTPVLAHNLTSLMNTGKVGSAVYDGYTSCPLFTGRGELLLAEFKYGLERKETFGSFVNQSKPNRAFYHLTKDILPRAYFSYMLKGEWYGTRGIFPPNFVPS
ncbi:putative Sulfide:quinone oxidoreductase mitochondrial precursor [Papiliotrema laurentii]|uniref:Sulfide:quinone oxidoreductase, mitochondrial n=1 Tax=Papiliotrema laurentii TaxID=5418 RepID=A0AAD9L7M7_PAPLA|nr:putative Sulfide:quinone oxidoreductase mitochondrial precursor [Papiliotrema laurentii]